MKQFYIGLADKTPYASDESKLVVQSEKIIEKAGNGGPGHYKMCLRLKKKYGAMPDTVKWSENSGSKKAGKEKSSSSRSSRTSGNQKSTSAKPNLHLASMEELMAEVLATHDGIG